MDPTRNLINLKLEGLPYNNTTQTLTVDDASGLPDTATDGEFNLVIFDFSYRDPSRDPNVEIVRVTTINVNDLTVLRGQEGTTATAKDAGKEYRVILASTKNLFDQIASELDDKASLSAINNDEDFYEEGTWSPTLTEGTVTVDDPYYIKNGNMVTVSCRLINFSDRTSTEEIRIGSLPFTISSQQGDQAVGGPAIGFNIDFLITAVVPLTSAQNLRLMGSSSGSTHALLYSELKASGSNVRLQCTYLKS